jgi:hypothetical protein
VAKQTSAAAALAWKAHCAVVRLEVVVDSADVPAVQAAKTITTAALHFNFCVSFMFLLSRFEGEAHRPLSNLKCQRESEIDHGQDATGFDDALLCMAWQKSRQVFGTSHS